MDRTINPANEHNIYSKFSLPENQLLNKNKFIIFHLKNFKIKQNYNFLHKLNSAN